MELEKRLKIDFPHFNLQKAGRDDTVLFFDTVRHSVREGLTKYLSTKRPSKYLGDPNPIINEYIGILPYGKHDPFGKEAAEVTNAEYKKHREGLIEKLKVDPAIDDRALAREATKKEMTYKPYSLIHMLVKSSVYMKNFEVPEFYKRFENGRSIRITAMHDKAYKGVELMIQMKPWFS
jgi:hypothetical protein